MDAFVKFRPMTFVRVTNADGIREWEVDGAVGRERAHGAWSLRQRRPQAWSFNTLLGGRGYAAVSWSREQALDLIAGVWESGVRP